MKIEQHARSGAVLEKIICHKCDNGESTSICALTFYFRNQGQLALLVNRDTDELTWGVAPEATLKSVDIEETFPSVINVYGLSLTWCWEMKNHQGYLDAVQLEWFDPSLRRSLIFQFKAAASNVEIYEVTRVSSETSSRSQRQKI